MQGSTDTYTLADGSARWRFRFDAPPQPDGSRRRVVRRGFTTRAEAEAAMRAAMVEADRGGLVDTSTVTVAGYLADWLDGVHVRPTTRADYRQQVRRLTDHLGGVRVQDLTVAQVERCYRDLLTRGGRQGQGLSIKTVRKAHAVLRQALAHAQRADVIVRNVADLARVPRPHSDGAPSDAVTHWTDADARAFLDYLDATDDRLAAMWHVFLGTGMRRGEVVGLRWEHVDLDAGTIDVARQRTIAAGQVVEHAPKSRAGRRTLHLSDEVAAALRSHRARQAAERLAAGPVWLDTGYVFTDEAGAPIHPGRPTEWVVDHAEAAGVARIRLHDTRHTFATIALRAGVPIHIVSQYLGHSDIAITLRTYAHAIPSDGRVAADAVAAALSGAVVA